MPDQSPTDTESPWPSLAGLIKRPIPAFQAEGVAPVNLEPVVRFEREEAEQAVFDNGIAELRNVFCVNRVNKGAPRNEWNLPDLDASRVVIDDAESATSVRLNWLHVEQLLDHAADLLDRALVMRQAYDDTAQKLFQLRLELTEFIELDAIHRREESEGLYDIPYLTAYWEWMAESLNVIVNDSNANSARGVARTWCVPGFMYDLAAVAARKGAYAGAHPPYFFEGQPGDGHPVFPAWNFDGENDQIFRHAADAAQRQLEYASSLQWVMLLTQGDSFTGLSLISARRVEGLRAQQEWAWKNRTFLRERTIVARRLQDAKLQAATLPDGPLNFGRRLSGIRSRWEDDVRFALAKLAAARRGLEMVYGYTEPFPSAGSGDYLDEVIHWTRNAIQWIITFASRDERMRYPISIRELITEADWVQGSANGTWSFSLTPDFFPTLAHCRLRGIEVVVVPRTDIKRKCGATKRLYRFEVTAPAAGHSRHRGGEIILIDQSVVNPVTLARVETRDSVREPDIGGTSTLHNACPCGDWKLTLLGGLPTSGLRADFLVEIADIHLDLHLVYAHLTDQ